ncbi:hypothetical protein GCM10027280_43520 [Micromonospora polyrhachis]|uniref:Uncharacterized protein n=1 Tax=Micromonospora polyrhachis TaxID=1282883 RepID=A0A7W7SUU5_9ACTN|nr:hypothetical protein [Micromonospora polyrhachis]MBB4961387.1 hypothetical protein [Micromonospora polyrhachis]
MGRRGIALVGVVAVAIGGCGSAGCTPQRGVGTSGNASSAELVRPDWRPVPLPLPTGIPGRVVLRDATACAGRWFVVGAMHAADGTTRPAAWTSPDARTWTPVTVAGTSFYGNQNVLYAAGCRDGRLAAIGAKSGGAHGNPRVSTWRQVGVDRLVEVPAAFELYGGPEAVGVSRIVGGPTGWLIVGNRTRGAATWVSRGSPRAGTSAVDAAGFDLVDGAPELTSDERGRTMAFDAVATSRGWLVVGGMTPAGQIDSRPLVWLSADGRSWRRFAVPHLDADAMLQRVTVVDGVPVVIGLRSDGFGAWYDDGRGWVAAGRFGSVGGAGAPSVRGVAVAAGRLVVAVSTGTTYELWSSTDRGRSWRRFAEPVSGVLAGGDSGIGVTAAGDGVLVSMDDGRGAGLWWTRTSTLDR